MNEQSPTTSRSSGQVRHIEQLMAEMMPGSRPHFVGKSKKTKAARIRAKKARRANRRR